MRYWCILSLPINRTRIEIIYYISRKWGSFARSIYMIDGSNLRYRNREFFPCCWLTIFKVSQTRLCSISNQDEGISFGTAEICPFEFQIAIIKRIGFIMQSENANRSRNGVLNSECCPIIIISAFLLPVFFPTFILCRPCILKYEWAQLDTKF